MYVFMEQFYKAYVNAQGGSTMLKPLLKPSSNPLKPRLLRFCLYALTLSLTLSAAAQTGGNDHDHTAMSGGQEEHETHDHDAHDHNDDMTGGVGEEGATQMLNTVAVGNYLMSIDPLVTPESVTLGLTLDTGVEDAPVVASGFDLSATDPQGETQALSATVVNDTLATVTLPNFAPGVWRIEGTLSGQAVSFPLALYQQTTPEGTDFYLALAPAPSLSTRGLTEVYAYAFEDGEFVHGAYTLQYAMSGMTHSTDDAVVDLEHTHFDNSLNEAGIEGSANHAPLSFAMAGAWSVDVAVTHEGDIRQATFDVTVSDE